MLLREKCPRLAGAKQVDIPTSPCRELNDIFIEIKRLNKQKANISLCCDRILMLDIYAKNEKEDLSAVELKQLRTLIEDYKT